MKFESFPTKKQVPVAKINQTQMEKDLEFKKDSLEKKIEDDLIPILKILKSDDENFDLYEKEIVENLFKDVQKIEQAEGKILPSPEYTAQKMKEVLLNRLKVLIEDSENYKNREKVDYNLVKKAKIVLLAEGDQSHFKKQYSKGFDDSMNFERFIEYYLGISKYNSTEKINSEEMKALMTVIPEDVLSKFTDYHYPDMIKETPDEYLQFLLNKNIDVNLIQKVMGTLSKSINYSSQTFRLLIDNDLGYLILKDENIKFFEKSIHLKDIEFLIRSFEPQYPYHMTKFIDLIEKTEISEKEKGEILDFVFKHQKVTGIKDYVNIPNPEIKEKYRKIDEEISDIVMNKESNKILLPENLPKEKLESLKKIIESGHITFFYNYYNYVKYFFENDYEWLRDTVIKNDQENLLFSSGREGICLKEEDQKIYINKLLKNNELVILKKMINERQFSESILDNSDYEKMRDSGLKTENHIELYSSIDEKNFENFKTRMMNSNVLADSYIFKNIGKFKFNTDKYEKEKSYQEFIAHINKCFDGNSKDFFEYFSKDFSFSNYNPEKSYNHNIHIKELSDFLKKITYQLYPNYFKSDNNSNWTKLGTAVLNKEIHAQNIDRNLLLGQEEYDKFKNFGVKCESWAKVSFFKELNVETLKEIVKDSPKWSYFKSVVSHFKLPDDSKFLKVYNETENIGDFSDLQEYYFNNFFNEVDDKRSKIFSILKNGQLLSKDSNFVLEFVKKFKDRENFEQLCTKERMKEIDDLSISDKLKSHFLEDLFSNETEKTVRVKTLIKEAKLFVKDNEKFIIYYVDKFKQSDILGAQSIEDRRKSMDDYDLEVTKLCKNQSIETEDKLFYESICRNVYPERNYNTYGGIDIYKDRSEDLNEYSFDKEGYKIQLSGVVGYKIKDGLDKNPDLLLNYKKRIKDIEALASNKQNILNFINTDLGEIKSKTIEGKLLEYVQKDKDNPMALDLLLAYQLSGHYDQFIRESADRTDMHENIEGKDYIMLSELSERYGDLMKETLKDLGEKIKKSEDFELFNKEDLKQKEKGKKLSVEILEDLSKIPEEILSTEKIQKKIIRSISNTFQQIPSIKSIAEIFAKEFTKENFSDFSRLFNIKINEIINGVDSGIINEIKKVEPIRQKIYEEIKTELDKYEEIKEKDEDRGELKMSKERLIKGYFSKNKENAHARMVGDICLATNYQMLENKNYFEFVMFDEERKKCVGTVMLLKMEEPDNKKYLLYCPNPSVDLVSQISAEKLYILITKEIAVFAKINSFDGVLLDKRHGHATNRSGLFQTSLEKSVIKNNEGDEKIFNLNKNHILSGNYSYQKDLNAVWLNE